MKKNTEPLRLTNQQSSKDLLAPIGAQTFGDLTGMAIVGNQPQASLLQSKRLVSEKPKRQMSASPKRKRFFLGINYPDLRRALLSRGWVESDNRHDETLDLKFTMQNDALMFTG